MSYELRPVKTQAQLAPLVAQFVENFAKSFGHEPDSELIDLWCRKRVIKMQEDYVLNYLEGYAVQDIPAFSKEVANKLSTKPQAPAAAVKGKPII